MFAVAAVCKLRNRAGAARALGDFGVPARLADPAAIALPGAELAVAGLLVATPTARAGAIGALTLLGLFVIAIGRSISRGEQPDCNCFGTVHTAPAGWTTLARNLVFGAVAAVVVAASSGDPGCGACIELLPALARAERERSDLTIALLTTGDVMQNRMRLHGRRLSTVLRQHEHEVTTAYAVKATPAAVLVDPGGGSQVRWPSEVPPAKTCETRQRARGRSQPPRAAQRPVWPRTSPTTSAPSSSATNHRASRATAAARAAQVAAHAPPPGRGASAASPVSTAPTAAPATEPTSCPR